MKELKSAEIEGKRGVKKLKTCLGLAFYKNILVQNVKGQSKWGEIVPVSICYQAKYTEKNIYLYKVLDEQEKAIYYDK